MMNISELRSFIENKGDMLLYKELSKDIRAKGPEYEIRFLATQIYKGTMKHFYRYNDNEELTEKAFKRLLKSEEETFAIIGMMSLYSYLLKNENAFMLIGNTHVEECKVTNSNIEYLMIGKGHCDYMFSMLMLSEKLGISDSFRNALMDYLVYNTYEIKDSLEHLDIFKDNEQALDRCLNEISYVDFEAV